MARQAIAVSIIIIITIIVVGSIKIVIPILSIGLVVVGANPTSRLLGGSCALMTLGRE